jgi:hypothetical protein
MFQVSQKGDEEPKEVDGKPVDPDTFVGDPEMLVKHPLQVCHSYHAI